MYLGFPDRLSDRFFAIAAVISRKKEKRKQNKKPSHKSKVKSENGGEEGSGDLADFSQGKFKKREVIFWRDFLVTVAIFLKGTFEERFERTFCLLLKRFPFVRAFLCFIPFSDLSPIFGSLSLSL